MIEPYFSETQKSLKKVQGQISHIQKMIEEGRYCVDIIQQSNAAIGLLRQANNMMLESHLETCGHKLNAKNGAEKKKFIQEIIRACNVSVRKN